MAAMGLFALLIATSTAETYKWTDERGVTTYGSHPPAGRAAQRIDAEPQGPVSLPPEQQRRMEADARRRADVPAAPGRPAAPTAVAPPPRGMAFDTYLRLERGMSEGELVQRAGQPDQVSIDDGPGYTVKSYYYLPTAVDPFVTIVTVHRGRIENLERTRKF